MLTGLNCVRKGPSDHGNDVSGFLKMWGISYPAREPTTDQKLCTVYFVRSDFIPRCPLRCGRGHHHTAGEEAPTVRNLTCSRRCQVRISALTGTNPTDYLHGFRQLHPGKFEPRQLALASFATVCAM
jgi:hypothetical protein